MAQFIGTLKGPEMRDKIRERKKIGSELIRFARISPFEFAHVARALRSSWYLVMSMIPDCYQHSATCIFPTVLAISNWQLIDWQLIIGNWQLINWQLAIGNYQLAIGDWPQLMVSCHVNDP